MVQPVERAQTAVDRWVVALNDPQRRAHVAAAVSDEVTIERMGIFAHQGQLVETFHGPDEVHAWLRRTPEGIQFATGDVPSSLEGTWRVRYDYESVDDFRHFGHWEFQLADDGRISWLRHTPAALPDPDEA